MTRIRAGEIAIDAEVFGEGEPTVLMIHGLGYGRWGWTWNAPALAERFRVVTFDNRGVGGSDAPEGPYTIATMAADAVALMDAMGIARAHVVGTSLGGFIAQQIAVEHPRRVDRLVLACTAFGGPDMVPMPEVTVRLMEEAPSLPDEVRLRRAVENGFTPAFAKRRPDVIERVMAFRRATAQQYARWLDQAAAGAAFDLSARVGSIAAPTLVITGVEDTVIDVRNSKLLAAAVPDARLVEMDGGHLFFIEQSEAFNDAVASFLAEGGESVAARQEPRSSVSNLPKT